MKKRFLAVFLAMVMCLSLLAGCGGDTEKTPIDSDKSASATGVPENSSSSSSVEPDLSPSGDGAPKPLVSTTDLELSPYLVKAQSGVESDLYGYIDIRTGEFVIEPRFTYCDDAFGEDGWAEVCEDVGDKQKNNESVINTSGELLFDYDALGNTFAGVDVYGDGCILVHTAYDDVPPRAYLYHGSQFVRELELPVENCLGLQTSRASYHSFEHMSTSIRSYMPDHFIVIAAEVSEGSWVRLWYDADGNFICQKPTDEACGCLVGDETGYYFIGDEHVYVIASDGSVTETLERKGDSYFGNFCGKVDWDGDNWYAIINLTGKPMLYTNELTPLFETQEYGTDYFALDVTDGIVRGQDGYWYILDGTPLPGQQGASYGGPFRNGYSKACTKWSATGNGEYHYVDMQGNKVLEIPAKQYDEYSSVLKDGYFIYGKDGLHGIMNIDGTVVTGMIFRHIYDL